jgi:hypothetical protein
VHTKAAVWHSACREHIAGRQLLPKAQHLGR